MISAPYSVYFDYEELDACIRLAEEIASLLTQEPDEDDEFGCVICYEDTCDVEVCKQCYNFVCHDCLEKLLVTPKSFYRCPMCRTPYLTLQETLDRLSKQFDIQGQIQKNLMILYIMLEDPKGDEEEVKRLIDEAYELNDLAFIRIDNLFTTLNQ